MTKKNRRVFLDVSIDGSPVEKMVFELFYDVAPKTAENFRALCTGEKGISPRVRRPLHYKGCFFHKIVKGSMAQGGDFYKRDGSYGESIYGEKFPDESSSKLKHDERGLLSMSIADRDTRGSLFAITFRALDYLDRKNIVFGKVVKGDEVLEKIENAGDDDNGAPAVTVKIINCGDYSEDKKRTRSSRVSNHKKSSRGRRKKKRRYYSSESETSTDSETDSSDYESDSESDTLSSSDFSSSSDDRRKKRKRSSKKDKYKRNKRRDKRWQRKRRSYKREKHTSKRSSICSASDDNGGAANDGKGGTESRSPGQKFASVANQNTEINGRGKGEFPRENGQRRPDGETTKSRNHSISPKSDTSRSMSISPRRALSPNVDEIKPKCKSISRSPSQSGRVGPVRKSPTLPPLPSRRSLSPSPVRSAHKNISRSPIRFSLKNVNKSLVRSVSKAISRSPVGNAHRSISKSPVRPPQRSVSKSPVRSFRKSMSISRSPIRGQRRSSRSPVKSYAQRYRSPTPDCSPVRSYRYARSDRDRYGRRSPSRRYRSPPKHRSPLRYRSRRSRARSPVRSYSPVAASRLRNSRFVERQRSLSHSSVSRSSLDSPPPKRETRSKSISFSSSGTPSGNKGSPGSGEG